MLLRGGPDVFDFKNHFLEINLRYRRDCGGNPSIAFRLESATTCPLSKIKPESGFGIALDSEEPLESSMKLISRLNLRHLWAFT